MEKQITSLLRGRLALTLCYALGAALCEFALPTRGVAQSFLTNDLVAYYPFFGNANDESGHGNNGVVLGGTLGVDRFGTAASAYVFDGTSSRITVRDSASLRIKTDITVVCWLSFSRISNNHVRIVGKGGDCFRSFGLWYRPTTGWLFQQFSPAGGCVGCQEITESATPTAELGRWYQLVGVRSGATSLLYLDGKLLRTRPVCEQNVYVGSEPLRIGAPDPVSDSRYNIRQGTLDEIRIYNRALSAEEVFALYARDATDPKGPKVAVIKAVKPSFSDLIIGTKYQLQYSADLSVWTDEGTPFIATEPTMAYPQYWDVDKWTDLFFRVKALP
jgi:hypothetical protein